MVINVVGCDLFVYRNVFMEMVLLLLVFLVSSIWFGFGDFVFVVFDNDIGSGVDRIVLVNLVFLEFGMEFMFINV